MDRLQITENFYLDEFTRSQTAARHGIEIVIEPDSEVFRNVERLCVEILQPVRDALGPVSISSGYRPLRVNRLVGGSDTSGHILGLCADFTVAGMTPYQVADWINRNRCVPRKFHRAGMLFDQCINEFGQWVHVGIAPEHHTPRLQALTAYKKASRLPLSRPKTAYALGIHRIEDLQKD